MTNTPERYDHHEDGMEIARDGDFVSYDDYAALLARAEQAEAEIKFQGNWVAAQEYWMARAEQAEAALKATLEREAETQRRHDARLDELEKAGRLAAQELRVIAGMDLIGASAVAFNAARALEAALSREEPKRCAEPDWNEWSSWPEGRTWTKSGEPKP
jgi:hypothetical protein